MKWLLVTILVLHALIHSMGFLKAFGLASIRHMSLPVSRTAGLLWLCCSLLLLVALILLLIPNKAWMMVLLAAVLLSQLLIMGMWQHAKWGSVINVMLLLVILLSYTTRRFESKFTTEAEKRLRADIIPVELITEADLLPLPQPVQRYLRYAGVLNQPKVHNMYVQFEGEMRGKEKPYMLFTSEQYNFFDEPARLFFMKAQMKGVTVPGYHRYADGLASMDIRLFGLFSMVRFAGNEMNQAETVTFFNDLCLLAPAALISKNIRWEMVDSLAAKAIFTTNGISVSAVLYFNRQGELIDFISNDRFEVNSQQWLPFSTPVSEYRSFGTIRLPGYGEAVWHYPDGAFTYGKFRLKRVVYNVSALQQ